MSRKIRFIHAADVHMGAPTRGLGSLTEEWATKLLSAIPDAYDRVIDAALARKVDFVVFAGDMFDASHASYCDYLRFFKGLDKLDEAGIPTYLVAGNHDPYTSWARDIARLPQSAHMLGIGVPTFELFEREGEPLCLIGGRSYYATAWPLDEGISDGITRENALGALSETHPRAFEAPFSIGIVHTCLDPDASKAATDEASLLSRDIDYWACGHLHRRLVRPSADNPHVVFPGCIQGRDIKEPDERGCYLVELEESTAPHLEFIPTASITFHSLDVDVSSCDTLSDVQRIVMQELFYANGHDYCSEMIAHVNLVGETDLHWYLKREDVIAGMRKHINDACPGFFCDAIVDNTRPIRDYEAIAKDDPIVARILHNDVELRGSKGELIDYIQSTFVQNGIAIPDALGRRIDDFQEAAVARVLDMFDSRNAESPALPAHEEIAQCIETRTNKAGKSDESIFYLGNQLEAQYVESRKAGEDADALKQADRELRELETGKADAAVRIASLEKEVEDFTLWREDLSAIDKDISKRREELERLHADSIEVAAQSISSESIDPKLVGLSANDDRILRDKLAEYAEERDKIVRAVDEAKNRSDASQAAYEALMEIDDGERRAKRSGTRAAQAIVSIILPVAFMATGIWEFIHGRQIGSLSFTILGISLVVLAFFLAAAAIVMLFRPNKDAEALENRRDDAHWVMLQDKKLLNARMAEKDELNANTRTLFAQYGLEAADGSVRQALMLLDDARDERIRLAEVRQRAMAIEMHKESAAESLAELESKRRRIEASASVERDASIRVLDGMLQAKSAELDMLRDAQEHSSIRYAELTQKLEEAQDDRSFDRMKLDYHQIRTRLRVAKHDYVVLLLAQKLLEN